MTGASHEASVFGTTWKPRVEESGDYILTVVETRCDAESSIAHRVPFHFDVDEISRYVVLHSDNSGNTWRLVFIGMQVEKPATGVLELVRDGSIGIRNISESVMVPCHPAEAPQIESIESVSPDWALAVSYEWPTEIEQIAPGQIVPLPPVPLDVEKAFPYSHKEPGARVLKISVVPDPSNYLILGASGPLYPVCDVYHVEYD